METSTALAVVGSVTDMARKLGKVRAPALVILLDTSSSMLELDAENEYGCKDARYTVAEQQLRKLQAELPGRVVVITFSDEAKFCPNGQPDPDWGGTYLLPAMEKAKELDFGKVRFCIISDGDTFMAAECIALASQFLGKVDGVFIGRDSYGRECLHNIVKAGRGKFLRTNKVGQLADTIKGFLGAGVVDEAAA